jgi:F-type H+-transporting ATPase subunit b
MYPKQRTTRSCHPDQHDILQGLAAASPVSIPMNQILDQLGGHVLGAVPTMCFFLLLVVAYGFLVRRPLLRVLEERRRRTSGAMDQAHTSISHAENRAAEYEDRMRKARAEILAAREQRLKQWQTEREQALSEARAAMADRISAGRAEIDESVADAQRQIDAISAELSEQILRAVLPAQLPQEVAQ